ncbi:uncharacterized protein LODBEIA_P10700 [Lodderomyces beijingensis]|uniref:NDT80 domain-containing protein n=1 Tax=Lodderomyces beijingensis TaxID=1775926 RepID=A0ABP0ZIB7_9ASCO
MSSSQQKKERIDDLASLFLPDTLPTHQNTPNLGNETTTTTNTEYNDSHNHNHNKQMGSNLLLNKDNASRQEMSGEDNGNLSNSTSYQDFLNSNNFINRPSNDVESEQPYAHINHFTPYLPYEANINLQHYPSYHNPIYQQYFPQQSSYQLQTSQSVPQQSQLQYLQEGPLSQLQSPQQLPHTASNNFLRGLGEYLGDWIGNGSINTGINSGNGSGGSGGSGSYSGQQPIQQLPETDKENEQPMHPLGSPGKKKVKGRKRDARQVFDFHIDYKSAKMKKLLDFEQSGKTSINDYKIVDNTNSEVSIDFSGFLNGRFFTNDTDNNNYIFTKNELMRNSANVTRGSASPKMEDPKVVSCYRRNYIQVLMNMKLSGLSSDYKSLKLQTSEYGYTTTRVIKYFKIEVHAVTDISNSKSVPIIIRNDLKDLEKEKEKEKKLQSVPSVSKDDIVQPSSITAQEYVVVLNDETSARTGSIDKFYVVKKLQFKNATPNNGNLTFQNYYHLKIKLSCIVADIYYDDYLDEVDVPTDLNKGAGFNNNEFLLAELVSEPIIVRGRNPSFYAERKDMLIKCRQPNSKKSFQLASHGIKEKNFQSGSGGSGGSGGIGGSSGSGVGGDDNDDDEQQQQQQQLQQDHHDENDDDSHTDGNGGREGFTDEDEDKMEEFDYGLRYANTSHDDSDQDSPMDEAKKRKLEQQHQQLSGYSTASLDLGGADKYKYFPISSHYYLPPVNVVYFPHRAHHPIDKEETENGLSMEPVSERKSSNVYFK